MWAATGSLLFVNAGWRDLPHTDLIDRQYLANLKTQGFTVDVCRMTELDRARLFQHNVAVLLWLPPVTHTNSVDYYRERLPLLREFVESGGGLFFNYTEAGTSVVYERTYYKLANELLAPWGLRAIHEVVRDPEHTFRHKAGMREYFIRTRNLSDHPITNDIDEITFPTYWWDQNSFQADANWTVLVRGEPTAYTTVDVDEPITSQHVKGSITTAPGIVAARNIGKGRVVFDAISPVYTLSDGYHYMVDGLVLDAGGVMQLHRQAFHWLAEPSLRSGSPGGFSGPSYSPSAAEQVDFTDVRLFPVGKPTGPTCVDNLPTFLGLYGAHSNLTDGTATVEELCRRAQELGYSYLVFTDPLELMTGEKYQTLKAMCKQASSEEFLALPGMEYSSDRLWSPYMEQPPSKFGASMTGRRQGQPRFLITYLDTWVGDPHGSKLNRPEPVFKNYPLSPDNQYVLDNGIVYVMNGQPRQCLLHPKQAGVGPWHCVLYNGFATHSYDGDSLFDDSLDLYLDRVANDCRVTPMTYHRITRPEHIPPLGRTFVSATRAAKLQDIDAQASGRGLVYPWRNHNYVTSGPEIELFGVQFADGRPQDYLVVREQEWKLRLRVSSPDGLSDVRVMDGTNILRRFEVGGKTTFAANVTGHHDKQHYLTVVVRDQRGGLAVSGVQVVHGWRHWYGMSGADLISLNDSTYQVGSNGRLDFAWCTGGVLTAGSQIGPRLNVHHEEVNMIARDSHSPTLGGRTGVMIQANEGTEKSLNRLKLTFASEECTVLDQNHEYHHEPGVSPTSNRLARAHIRWYSFTPRLYDWNLLLVETDVEILRDLTLQEGEAGSWPRLVTLRYAPAEVITMDNYALRRGDDQLLTAPWNPEQDAPLKNVRLPVGGYVGLYPGTTAAMVVYSLDGHAHVSMSNSSIRFGTGNGGEKLHKGDRLQFEYVVGLKSQLESPAQFEMVRRVYGLDGSAPGYTVQTDSGNVESTTFALRLRAENGYVVAQVSRCQEMPTDLPIIIRGLNDHWNVSLYDYQSGVLKRVGVAEGIAYTAMDINVKDRQVFLGHSFVCDDQRVHLELHGVDGAEPGELKQAQVEIHNPTVEDLQVVLSSPLFKVSQTVSLAAGTTQQLRIPLDSWTEKRITVITNELTDQLKRRTNSFSGS